MCTRLPVRGGLVPRGDVRGHEQELGGVGQLKGQPLAAPATCCRSTCRRRCRRACDIIKRCRPAQRREVGVGSSVLRPARSRSSAPGSAAGAAGAASLTERGPAHLPSLLHSYTRPSGQPTELFWYLPAPRRPAVVQVQLRQSVLHVILDAGIQLVRLRLPPLLHQRPLVLLVARVQQGHGGLRAGGARAGRAPLWKVAWCP